MKKISIILALLLAILFAYYLSRPSSYEVERNTIINAPKNQIYSEIIYFKKWENWSSWAEMDPTMQNTYEGQEGAVGSKNSWQGEVSGRGSMTISSLVPNKEMKYHLSFEGFMGGESDGYFKLEEVEGGTKVIMGFYGEHSIISRFFNMENAVGPSFDRSLEKLKALMESKNQVQELKVEQKDYPASRFLSVRHKALSPKELNQSFFAENFQKIALQDLTFETGYPSAFYYKWDNENQTTDMAVAIPIKEAPKQVEDGFELIQIPQTPSLFIAFYGHYDQLGQAHQTINEYIINNNLGEDFIAIEEYVTDPGLEPNPEKWLTHVYYLKLNI